MKKYLTMLLALLILVTHMPLLATAETLQPPAPTSLDYSLIVAIHSAFYIENGTIQMSGTVTSGGRATYAYVKITLQKKSGSSWTNVKSWSATGTSSATKMATYTPEAGVFYRLKVYGYVSNSTESESDSYTTAARSL